MHDIRIFLEDNGQFWAVARLWREKIYALGDSQQELISELYRWIELAWIHGAQAKKMESFFQ